MLFLSKKIFFLSKTSIALEYSKTCFKFAVTRIEIKNNVLNYHLHLKSLFIDIINHLQV